ncbi:hypothetical protein [Neptunitalea lumnitzerae]|uniref:Uncharacterized protein n=1 Tax=Neptunitalea lumnitzerae TaxID=2965509 RepID=A0ABQ5MGS5_9FLAO|nr:hypothetical protein [Neptunitalea sp. Y10]GLB48595.1 hypothetical protein Y10_09630 [Neptunitalea sp. Y10]
MKRNKNKKDFAKKILNYGTIATVMGVTIDASGQIEYTDVNPDFGGSEVIYELDLNNDNQVDFTVVHTISSGENVLYFDTKSPGAEVMGEVYKISEKDDYGFALGLDNGDVISYRQKTWLKGTDGILLNSASCYSGFSNWCGVEDKYVGLRFKIDGNVHYGWARLDVSLSGAKWVIKDYAYNTEPNASIRAGEKEERAIDGIED